MLQDYTYTWDVYLNAFRFLLQDSSISTHWMYSVQTVLLYLYIHCKQNVYPMIYLLWQDLNKLFVSFIGL